MRAMGDAEFDLLRPALVLLAIGKWLFSNSSLSDKLDRGLGANFPCAGHGHT